MANTTIAAHSKALAMQCINCNQLEECSQEKSLLVRDSGGCNNFVERGQKQTLNVGKVSCGVDCNTCPISDLPACDELCSSPESLIALIQEYRAQLDRLQKGVVTCRNCRYYIPGDLPECRLTHKLIYPHDFCSYGVEKED